MDDRQHRHESALEHNSTVDTEITGLAKGRNRSRKTYVSTKDCPLPVQPDSAPEKSRGSGPHRYA